MATVEEQLKEALDDTVKAITGAAEVRIGGEKIEAVVMKAAEREWRTRYSATFLQAINSGKKWADDKDEVLERAREVGKLATHIAILFAIGEELVRAGVGGRGQDVSIQDTAKPTITSDIAGWAAGFIDCEPTMKHPMWDWCPRPSGTALQDALSGAIGHIVQKYNAAGPVAAVHQSLK